MREKKKSRVNYTRDSVLEIIAYVRYREEVKIKKGEVKDVRGREMRETDVELSRGRAPYADVSLYMINLQLKLLMPFRPFLSFKEKDYL